MTTKLDDTLHALSRGPEHVRALLAALDGSRDIPKTHAGLIASARQWLNRYDCGELPTQYDTGAVVL